MTLSVLAFLVRHFDNSLAEDLALWFVLDGPGCK